jgi:hypothetical protein
MTNRYYWVWFLYTVFQVTIATVLYNNGMIDYMLKYDFTYISVSILSIYTYISMRIGIYTYRDSPQEHAVFWFISDSATTLGMIGTILGFLAALFAMHTMDVSSIASIQETLPSLLLGIQTALITTLVGLAVGLSLKCQLMNLESSYHDKS